MTLGAKNPRRTETTSPRLTRFAAARREASDLVTVLTWALLQSGARESILRTRGSKSPGKAKVSELDAATKRIFERALQVVERAIFDELQAESLFGLAIHVDFSTKIVLVVVRSSMRRATPTHRIRPVDECDRP
jgi:hypothetical protein